jgi:glucokinase
VDAALALDIGGTKVAAGVVDSTGSVLRRMQAPTVAHGSEDDLWDVVAGLVGSLLDDFVFDGDPARLVVCGVGCGGPMTEGGELVSPLNIPAWRSFPLRARLAALLGSDVPVFVDNDAKALALGEGWTGAAAGERNYIAMVVSTGVGGGVVVDGRLLDGGSGNAGHIGHVLVDASDDARLCKCGARGCLEAEVSGTSIAEITGRPAAEASPEVIERAGWLLGRGIASAVVLLDLRLAVVAGSVALGWGAPFFDAVQRSLDDSARLSYAVGARVVPGALGHNGPVVGAAAVGWRGLGWRGVGRPGLAPG